MPFLTTTKMLFAKKDSVVGVSSDPLDKANNYATPTLSDVRVRESSVTLTPERDDEDSSYQNGTLAGDESITGKIVGAAKFYIKGESGEFIDGTSAQHKINFAKFFETSGCNRIDIKDSVLASTIKFPISYLFYPSSTAVNNTITLTEVVTDESKNSVATETYGAVGTFKISADGTGKPLKIEFDYAGAGETTPNGIWDISPTNTAKLAFDTANISQIVAEKYVNTSITITDLETLAVSTFCSPSLMFDAGMEKSVVECQNTSGGIRNNYISGMKPRLEITPMLQTLTNFDFWQGMTSQGKYSIDIIVDTTVANIPPIRLFVPRAELLNAPMSDTEGRVINTMTFRPLENLEKTLPTLKYYVQSTGLTSNFSYTGSSLIGNELGAMWFLAIGERERE